MTYLISGILALIISIIVAVQNADTVMFKAFLWEFEWPLALLLVLFFAVGLVFGLLSVVPTVFKKTRYIKEEKKKVVSLEKERDVMREKFKQEHLKNREHNISEL